MPRHIPAASNSYFAFSIICVPKEMLLSAGTEAWVETGQPWQIWASSAVTCSFFSTSTLPLCTTE